MDQRNENARIDGIIQSGKFVWKGNVYIVDIAQTRKDNSNYVSAERPVKYLHGISESGTPVKAWAHECSEWNDPEYLNVPPNGEPVANDPPQDTTVFVEPIEPEVMPGTILTDSLKLVDTKLSELAQDMVDAIKDPNSMSDASGNPIIVTLGTAEQPKQPHRSKKHKD